MLIRKTYSLNCTYQDLQEIDIWKFDLPEINYTTHVSHNFFFNGFNKAIIMKYLLANFEMILLFRQLRGFSLARYKIGKPKCWFKICTWECIMIAKDLTILNLEFFSAVTLFIFLSICLFVCVGYVCLSCF